MSEQFCNLLRLIDSSIVIAEDAVQRATAKALPIVRNIRRFSVADMSSCVINGKAAHWQVSLQIGLTVEYRTWPY